MAVFGHSVVQVRQGIPVVIEFDRQKTLDCDPMTRMLGGEAQTTYDCAESRARFAASQ
ncbi:hypothetical protein [Mycobacterium nebraskense]|uniref:hypothetical protein n=1 Tax=Mycobacterium nebraskense TaxID=244292 RepID=UPI0012DFEFE8|nr:hypothetical protein [Mycobacterium nebraskense]